MSKNEKNNQVVSFRPATPEMSEEQLQEIIDKSGNTEGEIAGLEDEVIPSEEVLAHMTAQDRDVRELTIRSLFQEYQNGKVHRDLSIQRGDVWTILQRSNLIQSSMLNFYIPELVSWNKDHKGEIHLLDGRQRVTTFVLALTDEFRFDANTPPAYNVTLAGKCFSELPFWLQERVLNYKLRFQIINDQDPLRIADMFVRLNSGTNLNKFQKIRAEIGTEVMSFINDMCELPFFKDIAHFTENQIRNMQYQKLIFAIMMVFDGDYDLSDNNIGKFAHWMRDNLNSERVQYLKSELEKSANYLAKVELNDKVRRQVFIITHIPAICTIINYSVDPSKFADHLVNWFPHRGAAYKNACGAGTAKASNVTTRLREIAEYFSQFGYPTENLFEENLVQSIKEQASTTTEQAQPEQHALSEQDRKAQDLKNKLLAQMAEEESNS